jgi:dienelactone hydrolase
MKHMHVGPFGLATIAAALLTVSPVSSAVERHAEALAPPWSAATAAPNSRDLKFTSGDATLSGTLWLPARGGPSPVVVVYHGASDPLRAASLYRHLIEMLPPLGIGVFVYDRRDSGLSTGPSANGSYTQLADDGIAARHMLEHEAGVDHRRIGYWGLSQGGWLAALAAERDPRCAFAISISAPMVTADVQMRFAVANILRIRGYDQTAIDAALDARRGVDDFMHGKASRPDAQRRLDAAAAQPWFEFIYMGKTFRDPDKSGWAQEMSNDPLEVMRSVKAPILVLYGAADPWVPVQTSMARLRPLERGHPNMEVHVISGADHAMMTSATPFAQVDPSSTVRQAPEAPEYFAIMTRWITERGLTATR